MIEIDVQFEELYKKYFCNIDRYVRAKGFPSDVAADIATDTFMRLWQKQNCCIFEDETALQVWLYKTASFSIKGYLRSKRQKINEMESESFEDCSNIILNENNIDRSLENIQLTRYTAQFETLLNEAQQQLLHLTVYEEKSDQEICELLRIKQTALQSRKHRLRNTLEKVKGILFEK